MTGWPLIPSRGGIFTVTFGQKTDTEELRTAPWMKMEGSGRRYYDCWRYFLSRTSRVHFSVTMEDCQTSRNVFWGLW